MDKSGFTNGEIDLSPVTKLSIITLDRFRFGWYGVEVCRCFLCVTHMLGVWSPDSSRSSSPWGVTVLITTFFGDFLGELCFDPEGFLRLPEDSIL